MGKSGERGLELAALEPGELGAMLPDPEARGVLRSVAHEYSADGPVTAARRASKCRLRHGSSLAPTLDSLSHSAAPTALFISNERDRLLSVARSTGDFPYIEHLLSLPFVRKATLRPAPERKRSGADGNLDLTTPRGRHRLVVEEKRSHLSQALVGDVVARAASGVNAPLILFAPYVSPEMGALLTSHGISFVDRAGNCHLDLGGSYVGHVEGRKLRRSPDVPAGLRAPGFRLVFALLVEPGILNAPARELARASGVSLGTASNVLRRLEQDRLLVRTKSKRHLVKPDDLIQRWIAGYAETLRPQIFAGRFQTQDQDPPSLEDRVAGLLARDENWAWGGAAAAFRLTKHYRSDETILHVAAAGRDLPKRLKAIPHSSGRLILMGVPGPLAFRGEVPHTVHPLLIYTELVLTGSDRAREAASELRERFLVSP